MSKNHSVKSENQEFAREFKGIWIPAELWLNSKKLGLSYLDVLMWAEIDSLSKRDIGCTASNEYFVNFFDSKERTIRDSISRLKKANLVEVIAFDGRVRRMRSLPIRPAEIRQAEWRKSATLPTPLYKEDRIVEVCKGVEPPAPPPPPKKPIPEKESFGKHVWLFKGDAEKLIEQFGKEAVKFTIEQINDYLDSNGKKPYKDYAATIRSWIRKDERDKKPKTDSWLAINRAVAMEARQQLKRNQRPMGQQIYVLETPQEKVVIRLDTGARIHLISEPQEFMNLFLKTFELTKTE